MTNLFCEICKRIIYGVLGTIFAFSLLLFIIGIFCLRVNKKFMPFILETAISGSLILIILAIAFIVLIAKQIKNCHDNKPDIERGVK